MGALKSFYENYLSLSLKEAFGVDLHINILILLIGVFLSIACFYTGHKQSTEALILKKLMRSESYGEEAAKPLSELGLATNRYAAKILSLSSGAIRTVVFRLGEARQSYEDYIAAQRARKKLSPKERRELDNNTQKAPDEEYKYYIPEDMKERAKLLFERNTSSPLRTVIYCVLILAFAFALILLMPLILELATASSAGA